MGVRLIVEVLDAAPETLTWRELYVLLVLAEAARDSTRQCWPGVEDNPDVVRRLRMGRSQRYGAIKALVDKGALVRVRRGQKGVRAVYAIPLFTDSQRPENRDPEPVDNSAQRPENPDAETTLSVRETRTQSDFQRPGFGNSASGFSAFSVRKTRTPSPQSPQSPHPRARETSKPGDTTGGGETEVVDRIIGLIEELSGQRVSRAHAAQVVRDIGPGKSNTLAYVEKCIRNDPARFVPTPQPPRFTAANGFES